MPRKNRRPARKSRKRVVAAGSEAKRGLPKTTEAMARCLVERGLASRLILQNPRGLPAHDCRGGDDAADPDTPPAPAALPSLTPAVHQAHHSNQEGELAR